MPYCQPQNCVDVNIKLRNPHYLVLLQGTLAGFGGLVCLNKSEIRLKRLTYKQG